MNTSEVITLLDDIAKHDKRRVTDVDIEVWDEALEDLNYADCRAAVGVHIRNSPDVWLKPGHVRAIVRAAQNDRVMRADRSGHNGCVRGTSCCEGPLISKPAWFDELVADSRLAARERWFDEQGNHCAYGGAHPIIEEPA